VIFELQATAANHCFSVIGMPWSVSCGHGCMLRTLG